LKNETDLVIAHLGPLVFVEIIEPDIVEDYGAGSGPVQSCTKAEQRGLSGAGRTNDGKGVALLKGKTHVFEDCEGFIAGLIGFGEFPYFEHGFLNLGDENKDKGEQFYQP
jgi:hypothetical protein